MGPKDVMRKSLDISEFTLKSYLGDLSDADLLLRPIEGMHPIALQLGHLINTERFVNELVKPGSAPPLPEGFEKAHDIKNADLDDSGFVSKETYLELMAAQRAHTRELIDAVPESELEDTRDGKLPTWVPTVGDALALPGLHCLMHYGQFVAVRRALKKPISF
jgi:DinB superfamily